VISGSHDPTQSGAHNATLSGGHDPTVSGGHDQMVSSAHNPFASGHHGAALSGAHDPNQSGAHSAAASGNHEPTLSGVKDGVHNTFVSAIHEPAQSGNHDATASSAHDAFVSGVPNAQLSGAHSPAVSGVHTAFESGLHVAVVSGAHDPIASGAHGAAVSQLHDAVLSGGHTPAVSDLHDPVGSAAHSAVLSDAHDPNISGTHTAALSGGHDPTVSSLHSPAVSAGGHSAVVSNLHAAAASNQHDAAQSGLHEPVVSGAHGAAVSNAHEPAASAGHNAAVSGLHNPIASGAHDATVSTGHNPNLSGLHTPALSGGHDAVNSAIHDPISSGLGGGPGGVPPNFPFDDLFGPSGPTAAPLLRSDGLTAAFGSAGSLPLFGGFVLPGMGLGESEQFIFGVSTMAQQAVTEMVLGDSLALGLGLQPGARLVDLGANGQVIVPKDFQFTAGWDSPPVGALFDVSATASDVFLANVGATLPAGVTGWTTDFFLPGSVVSIEAGLTPLTFVGASGTSATTLATAIGTGLETIWRYDAATQKWTSFAPGRPAFINDFSTLNAGDALLIKATAKSTLSQVDLQPRSGATRTVALVAGSNFVSYTGKGGDPATLLAGIDGLLSAFSLNAATGSWLSFSPGAPSFSNDLKTLSRFDALFLRLSKASSWSFAQEAK
jgi:hypothetical protein